MKTDYQDDILCSQSYSIISEGCGPSRNSSGRTEATEACTRCWYWSAILVEHSNT